MEQVTEQIFKTKAKRKLIVESDILLIRHRVEFGVPLNVAVRIIVPNISNVAVIKLYNWHEEMEEALSIEDFFLYDTIFNSMFPSWVPNEQPDSACYVGQFPYGYWEIDNGS